MGYLNISFAPTEKEDTYHVSSVVERDKRDSTILIGSLLEPTYVISLGICEVGDLGFVVIGSVGGRQVSHDRLDTDGVDD